MAMVRCVNRPVQKAIVSMLAKASPNQESERLQKVRQAHKIYSAPHPALVVPPLIANDAQRGEKKMRNNGIISTLVQKTPLLRILSSSLCAQFAISGGSDN